MCDKHPNAKLNTPADISNHLAAYHSKQVSIQRNGLDDLVLARDTDTDKFHCPGCSSDFATNSNLLRHAKNEAGHFLPTVTPSTAMDGIEGGLVPLPDVNCIYNQSIRVLICQNAGCKCAIEPKAIVEHLNVHGFVNFDTLTSFLKEHPAIDSKTVTLIRPNEHATPFQIDGIPLLPGYSCQSEGCAKAYASVEAFRQHAKAKHVGQGGATKLANPCHVQSIFGLPGSYIQVTPNPVKSGEETVLQILKRSLPAKPDFAVVDVQGPEAAPFLRLSRWHQLLIQVQVHTRLFDFSQQARASTKAFPNVLHALEGYVNANVDAAATASTLALRWVEEKSDVEKG